MTRFIFWVLSIALAIGFGPRLTLLVSKRIDSVHIESAILASFFSDQL